MMNMMMLPLLILLLVLLSPLPVLLLVLLSPLPVLLLVLLSPLPVLLLVLLSPLPVLLLVLLSPLPVLLLVLLSPLPVLLLVITMTMVTNQTMNHDLNYRGFWRWWWVTGGKYKRKSFLARLRIYARLYDWVPAIFCREFVATFLIFYKEIHLLHFSRGANAIRDVYMKLSSLVLLKSTWTKTGRAK